MTALADANLFLRLFVNDNETLHQKAINIFHKVEVKKLILVIRPEVVAEVVYALHSANIYNQTRSQIYEYLFPTLQHEGIKLVERLAVETALKIYAESNLDFVDALLIALARNGKTKTVCSFDQDFKNIDGVQWMQP